MHTSQFADKNKITLKEIFQFYWQKNDKIQPISYCSQLSQCCKKPHFNANKCLKF